MDKKRIIGFYNYTVVLTYMGMLFAFTGILNAVRENYIGSILCLMCSGICDMFDGSVACTKERNNYEKHFGIEIDSLSDLVSFGVLPAIFVFMISGQTAAAGFIGAAYVLCALIRLAYYNVQELERQKTTDGAREYFLGVPVTTIAILLPLLYLIKDRFQLTDAAGYLALMVIVTIGFVSGVEIRKPKMIGKIVMIAIGLAEFFKLFLMAGAEYL